MKQHPLCALVNKMTPEEFMALKIEVRTNGLDPRFPIYTKDGMILEGWHRWQAALACGIKNPPTVEWTPTGPDDTPEAFVFRASVRRNMTQGQLSLLKAELLKPKEDSAAKPKTKIRRVYNALSPEENERLREKMKAVQTGERFDRMARKVAQNPPLANEVREGKKSLQKAYMVVKKSPPALSAVSGPPERPRDHAGVIVRDPRVKAALDTGDKFATLARQFAALKRAVSDLAGGEVGWALAVEWQTIEREIDAAAHRVKSAMPWAACPLADHCADRQCPACAGSGWTTKDKYKACKP